MSRLDNYLVENGLCESRNKAQSIIKEGLVSVNNEQIIKSSFKLKQSDKVAVKEYKEYVSRAAFKLSSFLDELTLDLKDKTALDIGSSTGGFTQVLLESGVSEVTAVDVGREQLHVSLKNDSRVHSYEECDIREFESDKVFDIVVSDVAFISLLHILDAVDRLSKDKIILLFKPQFEVGREAKRDKNGVVTDEKAVVQAMVKFEDACSLKGWKLIQKSASKLTGKEGNLEYCYFFEK
ncbi:TlyA family RNA methyltransferase [Sulfurimonas sp.]|uniref:23S rRNA (cytidine-2'-O)-methyltransferase TlyA n=1 Tax=Sulfurimonas sp. TaxID=2022749 RepID=UPI0025F42D98|nr:TlyA family RNA methyltransferase [Sulfurimonas sp.]MCK9473097.1 TlyA family RNA methyltransferase [Sulfurimonas sp.]